MYARININDDFQTKYKLSVGRNRRTAQCLSEGTGLVSDLVSIAACSTIKPLATDQYLEYEQQQCPRNPGARGFGRVKSGSWFEAVQYRANQLAAATVGRGTKCAVAGLVWVSNTSFEIPGTYRVSM